MRPDPFASLADAPLFIVPRTLDALRAWRDERALAGPAGPDASPAHARLAAELDRLAGVLLAGIERHPTRFWVLKQCQRPLMAVQEADHGARQHVRAELERVLAMLGIDDADGVLGFYLGDS